MSRTRSVMAMAKTPSLRLTMRSRSPTVSLSLGLSIGLPPSESVRSASSSVVQRDSGLLGSLSSLLGDDMYYRWAVEGPEVVCRQPQPDDHDDRAKDGAVDPAGEHSPQVTADETADGRGHAVSPVDLAVDHEHDHGHAPQAPREQVLQGHDALDVTHPQLAKGTYHQNADSRPEVATVDGHNEHDSHRKRPQRRRQAAVFLGAPTAREPRLEHEQDRATEHQPRHETLEVPVARPDQQQRPDQPTQRAGDEEQPQPQPGYLAKLAAGTPYGARIGRKEGKGARCVGDHGRDDQCQQRECYQPATACERVDQAGPNCGHEEHNVSHQTILTPLAPHHRPDAPPISQRDDDLTWLRPAHPQGAISRLSTRSATREAARQRSSKAPGHDTKEQVCQTMRTIPMPVAYSELRKDSPLMYGAVGDIL